MSIVCPSCAAAYDVSLEQVQDKTLRCQRCGHQWRAVPDVQIAITNEQEGHLHLAEATGTAKQDATQVIDPVGTKLSSFYPVSSTTVSITSSPPILQTSGIPASTLLVRDIGQDDGAPSAAIKPVQSLLFGLIAGFLMLFAAACACYMFRDAIMQAWPMSIRLYAFCGLV